MSATATKELQHDPSAEDVNADNYGATGPISDSESHGMSPLSLPASLSTQEELDDAYEQEITSPGEEDSYRDSDPSP